MSNKQLAVIGMAGAPFLCFGMITEILFPSLFNSRFTGAWGIVYISAWMCTLVAVHRMNAFQLYKAPKIILAILFGTLSIANVSNIMLTVTGKANTPFYFYVDLCWPLSNVLMLVLGLSIIAKKGVPKKLRLSILLAGTWLPLSVVPIIFFGRSTPLFLFGGIYSLVNWTVLGYTVWRLAKQEEEFVLTA